MVNALEAFAADLHDENIRFELAAGYAGIEAATNIVIKQSKPQMLFLVYSIVAPPVIALGIGIGGATASISTTRWNIAWSRGWT